MCILFIAYQQHPEFPLIIAANRDEFYARATEDMHWWPDKPILAGRDLQGGGTWLGTHRNGRFAALTNFRAPHNTQFSTTRGSLVTDFLTSTLPVSRYSEQLAAQRSRFDGYNLLMFDGHELAVYSNHKNHFRQLLPGVYGLSNAALDTPWPKRNLGVGILQQLLTQPASELTAPLFNLLKNTHVEADSQLPDTGVGLEWERRLAPIFIRSEHYGTRCSSLVFFAKNGDIAVHEKRYQPQTDQEDDTSFTWQPVSTF